MKIVLSVVVSVLIAVTTGACDKSDSASPPSSSPLSTVPGTPGARPAAVPSAGDSQRAVKAVMVLQDAIEAGNLDFKIHLQGDRNQITPGSNDPPKIRPVTVDAELKGDELHVIWTDGTKKEEHSGTRGGEGPAKMNWSMAALALIGPMLDTNLALATTATSQSARVKAGTDTVDGRTCDKYQLAPAGATDVSGQAAQRAVARMVHIKNVTGSLCVDQETGAVLQLDIQYDDSDLNGHEWKQHDVIAVSGLKKTK